MGSMDLGRGLERQLIEFDKVDVVYCFMPFVCHVYVFCSHRDKRQAMAMLFGI